ncbi:MAG TPA: NAD-binding protein [Gemmataceae bacterium]|nr:NAD-binding protein [Gemmataceae bacterium]
MKGPIVLCGLGRMGSRILETLREANLPVVVVDNACRPNDPRLGGARLVSGDCRRREVLEAAGVADCGGVLILTNDDLLNVTTALTVRAIHPDVNIVVRMFNHSLISRLGAAVHNVFALSTSLLTAPIVALTALTGQALGAFRLEGLAADQRQIAEVVIQPGCELRGRPLASAFLHKDALPLAHLRADGTEQLLLEVDLETPLAAGDQLVVCGEPRAVAEVMAAAGEPEPPHLRWAGWLRRFWRMTWGTIAQIDRPVLICTLVLIAVLLGSTLLLHSTKAGGRLSYGEALLRTVGVMATVGQFHEDDFDTEWMRFYIGFLRIAGAALTAVFTAIITNYLLRARLRGALEVRRIPDGGHIVVCGLSPVGFRVVEELVQAGQRPVVIEVSADNRFVTTARRLGAAVIIGDMTVGPVLRQAHAGTARAVVAATNHDLVNIETALLVRELNRMQRVVLLLSDPQLAKVVRESVNIRLAVSQPGLAAPAFVAGLYGQRVLSVFSMSDRLFAVIDLIVQPQDAVLIGQTVRAVAVDYRLAPIAVLPARGPAPDPPLAARLDVGDRLAGVIALSDLDNLLQRRPAPQNCTVEATAVPQPARPWLAGLLRTLRGVGQEEAEKMVGRLPLRLAAGLTRGQAQELLAQLARERVAARLTSA